MSIMGRLEEILKEGIEGYAFRDVINNLTDEQIIECIHEYTIECIKATLSQTYTNIEEVIDILNKKYDKNFIKEYITSEENIILL